jgi:putative heme-binding domain-containing protein
MYVRSATLIVWLYAILLSAESTVAQQKEDQPDGPALAPAESLKEFVTSDGLNITELLAEPTVRQPLFATFDVDGRMWVVQYLQYPEPAGIKQLSRDNFWRIVYDRLPKPPGQDVPGADRITLFEKSGGSGEYKEVGDFVSGLNIATSIVPTSRGAWILQPPYLLFYPDANGDLKADGPPEVHLQGFGMEDTHSVVNSLCMGPDGWLYAAQGSTVSAAVSNYGSSEPPQKSMGQLIWRYHPDLRKYEIYAEGGGNSFGVAFDDSGRVFSGHNGGDTRGFHYVQGGYFRKGFNKHGNLSNPYSFGYLMPMEHDPIQRFTHTMLAARGTSLEEQLPNSLLCVDPLHGTLVNTKLIPRGSTYRTVDVGLALKTTDKWFRPVAIADGPDGAAYVCDWYDFQVAHIYAHVGKLDKDHGRIYRVAGTTPGATWEPKKARGKDAESLEWLLVRLKHPYRWQRSHARQLIAEHPLRSAAREPLRKLLQMEGQAALEALWTMHLCGWIADTIPYRSDETPVVEFKSLTNHASADVRSWAVRLVCDDQQVASNTLSELRLLAERELEPQVLSQIACSAKRLTAEMSTKLVATLLKRDLPLDDLHLPHLIWWAVEKHADDYVNVEQNLTQVETLWDRELFVSQIAPKLVKRWALKGGASSMANLANLLRRVKNLSSERRARVVPPLTAGFEEAFEGRTLASVPDTVLNSLIELGQPSLALRLRRGDKMAFEQAMTVVADSKQPQAERVQLLQILGQVQSKDSKTAEQMTATLLRMVTGDKLQPIKSAAIAALAHGQGEVAESLLSQWSQMSIETRLAVGALLASRSEWTVAWISAVEKQRADANDVPLEVVRSMRLHSDPALLERLAKIYPVSGTIDLPKAKSAVAKIAATIDGGNGDPYAGKKLYMQSCGRCHILFDGGGQIGPSLTGYQRDQLATLTLNIVGPSLEVREGYQSYALLTESGQLLTGYIEQESPDQVTLRAVDGLSYTIERERIESMKPQPQSLMPEGLLDNLSDQQIRDLFAYLRSSQPLSDGT